MRAKKSINVRVGHNLAELRKTNGVSQIALAETLGMTPNHLSSIERGLSGLTLDCMERCCFMFAVDPSYFLWGNDESPEECTHIGRRLSLLDENKRAIVVETINKLLDCVE